MCKGELCVMMLELNCLFVFLNLDMILCPVIGVFN